MIKEKLRRCPFCGKRKGLIDKNNDRIVCEWCGAAGPPGYGYEKDAVAEWNSRSRKVKGDTEK